MNNLKIYEEELDEAYEELWKAKSAIWKSSLVSLLLGIAFGWLLFSEPAKNEPAIPTVEQMIQSLPLDIRRAIAIDYCASGTEQRRMCKALPMSSPINPMDWRQK